MTAQQIRLAHDSNRNRIAQADTRQLGLFEIALDMEGVAIHQGEDRTPGGGIVPGTELDIGQNAVDRRVDRRALKIQLGDVARHHCLLQGRLGLSQLRPALLKQFGRNQIAEAVIALVLQSGLVDRCLLRRDQSFRLVKSQLEAWFVDDEQRIAPAHGLVVVDQHIGDEAGHVGRHLHRVRANAAIAGPRIDLITLP